MENKTTLYTSDSKGKTRIWQCWQGTKDDIFGIFCTDGQLGGKIKDPIFSEAKAQNVGKSNATTPEQQSHLMVEQEVGKKLRSNYFRSIEEIADNKLWLPMLCPSGMVYPDYIKKKPISWPALASNKLDGARCNAMLKDGKVYLQTRTGKEWLNCNHIKESLKPFFEQHPTIILDGEFYNHALKYEFEELMSILRKQKPTPAEREYSKANAEYHIYDYYDKDDTQLDALDRDETLTIWFKTDLKLDYILHEKSEFVESEEHYTEFHNKALAEGYEGSILRLKGSPYDVDKRSPYLLKRKEKMDTECEIIDVIEGEGTNKGVAAKIIIKHNGVQQDAGMARGWNHIKCKDLLENKISVIGQQGTVEYFGLTEYGKLRFPKFKSVRDYE
jgi:hypothetical protein